MNLAILVWSVGPDQADLCAAPFVYALAASALDCDVEMHFAGPAVRLLESGVADGVLTSAGKPVRTWMDEASAQGVRFLACSMAAAVHLPPDAKLIPQGQQKAGATAFVNRVLDPDWRTLVF